MGVPLSESVAASGPGAGDMFLSVNGAKHGPINGEAQDHGKHKDEIEVLAWSWGMQGKSSLGGGVATGKATIRELRITKRVDKASTALMSALRTNEPIKEAILTLRKIGKTPLEYFTIKIEDGRVVALEIEAGDGSNAPSLFERVSFSFNKISVQYTPQGPDGGARGSTSFEDQWTTS
jgi:type VI secretion system secreted protein Hcp